MATTHLINLSTIFITCAIFTQSTFAQKPTNWKIDLAKYDAKIKPQHRLHWAYQPIKPSPIPSVKNTAWVRNPIDAFVLTKLEDEGRQPAPAAPARVLVRRAYLDVLGLPPTLAEQAAAKHSRRRQDYAVGLMWFANARSD